jgi:hypothetical protein
LAPVCSQPVEGGPQDGLDLVGLMLSTYIVEVGQPIASFTDR